MKKFLTAFLLYAILAVITGACFYLCWFIFHIERTGLIDWAIQLLQKKNMQGKIEAIYTSRSHTIIQSVSVILVAGVLFMWLWIIRNRARVFTMFYNLLFTSLRIIVSFFKNSVPKDAFVKYFLFAVITFAIARSLYYIFTVPVSFDEADTWLLFISKGPVMIASFYPFPNNHIFYNWCVWFCSFLPVDTTVLLRIPLIPALPAAIVFIFRLAKYLVNERASVLSVAFFTFSFPLFHYSYTARGYLFILLFALIALWCLVMLDRLNKKRYRLALVASLVAGFYTVPTFLYFAAPVLIFFFIRWLVADRQKAIMLVKHSMVAAALTLLLYTPVFLVSGTSGLFDFYGRHFTYAEMGNFIQLSLFELTRDMFGRPAWAMLTGSILFLLLLLYGLLANSEKRWFYVLCFITCLLPVFVFFVQKQPYPARAWVHLLIFISLAVGTIAWQIKNQFVLAVVAFTIIFFRFYPGFHENHLVRNDYDQFVKQVAGRMIAEKRSTLYINKNYIKPLFDFYFQSSNFPATIYLQKGLYRRDEFNAEIKYSAIIWRTNDPNMSSLQFPYDTAWKHRDIIVLFAK